MISYNAKYLQQAFHHYGSLNSMQRNIAINSMLKLCLDSKNKINKKMINALYYDIIQSKNISDDLLLKWCRKMVTIHPKIILNLLNYVCECDMDRFNLKQKTLIIDLYSQCYDIKNALKIYDSIPSNKLDIICIGCMMKGYINNNYNHEAIKLYDSYNGKHNDFLKHLYIKSCINLKSYTKGLQFVETNIDHNNINNHSIQLINTLIEFYFYDNYKLDKALKIFDSIDDKKLQIETINVMIKGYIKMGKYHKAIKCCDEAKVDIDNVSIVLYLKACININDYHRGEMFINSKINNLKKATIEVKNKLIDFYGCFGEMENAINVYESIKNKDVVSINTMMKCLINNNKNDEALTVYHEFDGKHNDISKLFYLKACMNNKNFNDGHKIILDVIHDDNKIDDDINNHCIEFIDTIIEFYGNFGKVTQAKNVYDKINFDKRDKRTINAMMKALNNNGQYWQCLDIFDEYNKKDIDIDNVSILLYLKACININDYDRGKILIEKFNIIHETDIKISIELRNLLIDFYGKCDDINKAIEIYNRIPMEELDIICINSMMNAYNHCHEYDKTLKLFYDINNYNDNNQNHKMDAFCYSLVLNGCAGLLSLVEGEKIIQQLITDKNDKILNNSYVKSSIISMYSKCGQFENAIEIGKEYLNLYGMNKFICSSLMDCYAKMGDIDQLLLLFNKLKINMDIDINIDHMIFCIVLNGCAHSGIIDEALLIFEQITKSDKQYIHPNILSAMIDCFARTNHLNTAEYLYIKYKNVKWLNNKCKHDILKSLISACKIHNDHDRLKRLIHKSSKIN